MAGVEGVLDPGCAEMREDCLDLDVVSTRCLLKPYVESAYEQLLEGRINAPYSLLQKH